MPDATDRTAEQFDTMAQQRDAARLGMWVFLVTEFLFFGALFAAYTVIRVRYPAAFAAGSGHNNLPLGTAETAVLLTSSLTMALAVEAAARGRRRSLVLLLAFTMLLGGAFLAIHGLEYRSHYAEHLFPGGGFAFPGPDADRAELFFYLYFVMTGFHMLHVLLGVLELGVIAWLAARGRFAAGHYAPVEVSGLYWHFVDIVWIFLFPLFYLVSA
jgi:cytochrome c oxidase subunit 3